MNATTATTTTTTLARRQAVFVGRMNRTLDAAGAPAGVRVEPSTDTYYSARVEIVAAEEDRRFRVIEDVRRILSDGGHRVAFSHFEQGHAGIAFMMMDYR